MSNLNRRQVLAGAAAAVAAPALGAPGAIAAPGAQIEPAGPLTVPPQDPRYANLVRGDNYRFAGSPDYVRLVTSPREVEQAVAEALAARKRVAVRSGGHCLEDFVFNPDIRVIIDMSQMSSVYFDPGRDAVVVEAGATLGHVYDTLYKRFGMTVPGGVCPQVGAGGHICGGGYGALSRMFGLVVDYLYAIEVVVVDRPGVPRTVIATREATDPNRELWWAHTGGGGGNFGVITRYWLRGPRGNGEAPFLPKPPRELVISELSWPRDRLDAASYRRLIKNFTVWHEHNSAPDSPYTGLFATLWAHHIGTADPSLTTQFDAATPDARRLLADFLAEMNAGVNVAPRARQRTLPWLFGLYYLSFPDYNQAVGRRIKDKSAYLRAAHSDAQVETIHRHLTRTDYPGTSATMLLAGYGGKVNAVAEDATAIPQRDSVIKAQYSVAWQDAAEDPVHIGWVRDLYRDLFAETGGVPVSNATADGAYINYPDVDLADPRQNTSGVPWHTLYYKDNYPRLQQVKARWDPSDVFRHALGVRPSR